MIEFPTETAPGGWRLTFPQTGGTVAESTFPAFHRAVNVHLAANGYPSLTTEDLLRRMNLLKDDAAAQ